MPARRQSHLPALRHGPREPRPARRARHHRWHTADRTTIRRINRLIDAARQEPFTGIGKPDQLSHPLAGAWSRRMNEEHRLVYPGDGDDLVILQVRFYDFRVFT